MPFRLNPKNLRDYNLNFLLNKNIFVASTGNPVSPGMPGVVFRRVWTRAGLEWPQAGKRPRPYD